eukprot:gene55008-11904_t
MPTDGRHSTWDFGSVQFGPDQKGWSDVLISEKCDNSHFLDLSIPLRKLGCQVLKWKP